VKFPIGGKVRERSGAGFGAIPKPTVTVWMEEDAFGRLPVQLYALRRFYRFRAFCFTARPDDMY